MELSLFARATPSAIASMAITLHPDSGDAYVDGLPATKIVNAAGDTVTTVATCSGQVRQHLTGSAGGSPAPIVVTHSTPPASCFRGATTD